MLPPPFVSMLESIIGEAVLTPNQRLEFLQKSTLLRDDESDPGGRVYWGEDGSKYFSVTRILQATNPPEKQKALERWLQSPGATMNRDTAARRGTAAHAGAEYLLKTSKRLAMYSANKRNGFKTVQGLKRPYSAVFKWAVGKTLERVPPAPWGIAGYQRGLTNWIAQNVDGCFACEFSVYHSAGFAGTADALLWINNSLMICDWKTTQSRNPQLNFPSYSAQAGAYSLGLRERAGIEADGAVIVLARRSGAPIEHWLNKTELKAAEEEFLERCERFLKELPDPAATQAA